MVDKRPAGEYMEDVKKAINKLDAFNERHHISGKAFSSFFIIILIIILCGIYVWQRKHPKEDVTPAPVVQTTESAEETGEGAEAQEPAPEEAAAEEASSEESASKDNSSEEGEEGSGEEEPEEEESSEEGEDSEEEKESE